MEQTFADIVRLWKSDADCGQDVGATKDAVQQWRLRNRIPPEWWTSLIGAAAKRQYVGVTSDALTRLAAKRKATTTV